MSARSRILTAIVVLAIPFAARWYHQEYRAPVGGREGYINYLLLGLLCVLILAIVEAPPVTTSISRVSVAAVGAALLILGAAATSQMFFPVSLPRFVILLTPLLVFAWLVLFGSVLAVRTRRAGGSSRVVAVVSAAEAAQLKIDAEEGPFEQPFAVVATVTSENERRDLAVTCHTERATTLVLGPDVIADASVIDQAEALHRAGVRVRSLDDFYDESLGKLPLSTLDRFALMGDIESLHGAYAPLKRAIDLLLALLGSVALAVLVPFVLVGNLIGNRGPLFFRQERVGRGGQPFQIWKLRTMQPGAEDVSGWTSNNDPRITAFGRVLRRTHVDELPQVINIFTGDLAVVGPRPEQVSYARQLEERLPFYAARHLVRPGLTGWAQVKYRYAASEEDAYVKLQYDLHYVRHESLATDLRVIWLTFRHIVRDGGR